MMTKFYRRNTVKIILLAVLAFTGSLFSQKNTILCRTADDVAASLKTLVPGKQIVLADGEYRFASPLVVEAAGSKGKPIVIRSENRNKAFILGNTSVIFRNASYITIEGLVFNNNGSSAILLEGCNNIRITRNIFRLHENGRGSWVMVTGNNKDTLSLSHHNMIDRNLFEEKKELGNFITIEGTKTVPSTVSQHDVIEWNYFRNIGPRVENVLEAIRIGSAEYTLSRGYTILQNNLFERCDGDPEYISIKQSDCTVRNNTFIECLGSLSLRHGNHSTVEGNVIIGSNRTGTFTDSTGKIWTLGTGGIRFCADSMMIVGNYCEGLTGKEWDATVAATNGDADYGEGKPLTKHYRITNALIENNIFVDNTSGIEIGFDGAGFQGNWWHKAPDRMMIRNNIITGSSDTLVKFMDTPTNTVFENNTVYSRSGAATMSNDLSGVKMKDPRLVRTNGLLLPKGLSPSKMKLRRLTANDVGPHSR